MKKMRNGRRGFTLLEIVIVVAIIVILSAAAFLGVAATLNRANDAKKNLSINNGNNFEAHAINQVNSYGKNAVYWDPIPDYTPENQAKKKKQQMIDEEGWTDSEITFVYEEDGWHIVAEWDPSIPEHHGLKSPEEYKAWSDNYNYYIGLGYTKAEIDKGCKDGSTDIKPVYDRSLHNDVSEEEFLKQQQGGGQQGGNQQGGNQQGGNQQGNQQGGGSTPAGDKDKNKDTESNENTTPVTTPEGYPKNFNESRVNTSSSTVQTASAGSMVSGATRSIHWAGSGQVDFGTNCESVVVHLPDGVVLDNVQGGNVIALEDGYYRINFTNPDSYPTNVSFKRANDSVNCYDVENQIYVSEKVVHNY